MDKPTDQEILSDEQCDSFRRLPGSFNDMVRAIYAAGMQSSERDAAMFRFMRDNDMTLEYSEHIDALLNGGELSLTERVQQAMSAAIAQAQGGNNE